MHGAEYDEMTEAYRSYKDKFESVTIAEPLSGRVGDELTSVNDDKKAVAEAITAEAVKDSRIRQSGVAEADGTAFVFMGHGTPTLQRSATVRCRARWNDLGL